MERSAVYRRALAPVMSFIGILGTAGAISGHLLKIDSPRGFIFFWVGIAFLALAGSFLLVRRQALHDAEPFWSPPTRRVTEAFLPPLTAGFIVGLVVALRLDASPDPAVQDIAHVISMLWLPLGWIVLYGCALHAAGFFMPRGMKILGWFFVLGGPLLFAAGIPDGFTRSQYAYGIMGFFFGALQLAYGIYLYFTEKGKNAA